MTSGFDLSWAPNERDRLRLQTRSERLNSDAADGSVATTTANLRGLRRHAASDLIDRTGGVQVRAGFVYLAQEAPPGASDRRAPAPEHRPPSTRLMARRGIALRLMLTSLFEAQTRVPPGGRVDNPRPLSHPGKGEIAWTGLVATDAEDAIDGKTVMTKQDKQRRHLGSALDRLADAGLMTLPYASAPRNKHRHFQLRMEDGRQSGINPLYTVPRMSEDTFVVPAELFTRGWISVLTDAELAFLLAASFLSQGNSEREFSIAGKIRLLRMGIGPETYEAHRTLSRFGLVTVTHQASREANGRVFGIGGGRDNPVPDIVQFHPDGLAEDAYDKVLAVLAVMVGR